MTLAFLYGAPAVGKLTTAKALSAVTGFRVFHNHVAFAFAKAIFDFPSPPFGRLMERVRLAAFEAVLHEKLPGLIFTFVYAPPHDDAFVQATIDLVERAGGTVAFVRLVCSTEANEARVDAADRAALGKITTVAGLRAAAQRWDLTRAIPFRPGLEIDNSTREPGAVARHIADHFGLPGR
jgi:hypothetical protein